MKIEPEKSRLVTNIIFFGLGCALVVIVVIFCIVVSIKPKSNREETSSLAENVDGGEIYKDTSEGTDQSTLMNGEILTLSREYYLIDENGKVSIYEIREGENVFYDYAAVEESLMPEELRQQIKKGLHISSEAELYEFLQTYSS